MPDIDPKAARVLGCWINDLYHPVITQKEGHDGISNGTLSTTPIAIGVRAPMRFIRRADHVGAKPITFNRAIQVGVCHRAGPDMRPSRCCPGDTSGLLGTALLSKVRPAGYPGQGPPPYRPRRTSAYSRRTWRG